MTKTILVTGAGGFLGARLAVRLSEHHRCVYGLLHDRIVKSSFWQPLQGDITDYRRMLEIIVDHEIDQIYHCAAKSIVRNCRVDPVGCFYTNVTGTATVLEAARQSERIQGVMCMESDKAYGNGPTPYLETQVLQPGSVYEASKACVSQLVQSYWRNYDVPVYGIRSANIYGPGDKQTSRLIPNVILRLLDGKRPQITEGAWQFVREFIYLDDAITYLMALMDTEPWGESFNIGTGEALTIKTAVKIICEAMGKPFDIEEMPRPATLKEIPVQVLSLGKLKQRVPPHIKPLTLRQGLPKTIQWYKEKFIRV